MELRERLRHTSAYLRDLERHHALIYDTITSIIEILLESIQAPDAPQTASFSVELLAFIDEPIQTLQRTLANLFDQDIRSTPIFQNLREHIGRTLSALIERHRLHKRATIADIAKKYPDPATAIADLAAGTPFADFFKASLPFSLPKKSRFEHAHIVGGSGHGKTQLLQLLILQDIERAKRDRFGFTLIDSQGDLIGKLTHLDAFNPNEPGSLSDRLILIDPNDLDHPPALNLFDANLDRFKDFSPVEREKIFHGTLELYSYIFSSLLGAELTQKQGVVFTNLARAMLAIPNPTILTFYDFMEDGTPYRDVIDTLDPIPRRFFQTQFFTGNYSETRKQIINRLLGVLSQPVFEKMFSSHKNKIDLFGAMQHGKIIVINTAKDLLKSEGSSMFGRFFIALLAQATVARASLPEHDRTPHHVYIDEGQEYLDYKTQELFNQGRKYNVGVTIAHQNLDQLTTEMRSTLHASTSIKIAGGVNYKDAQSFANEMNSSADFIQKMKKHRDATEFACFVRHHTHRAVTLTVPFGAMERAPVMTPQEYKKLQEKNRKNVSAPAQAHPSPPAPSTDECTPPSAPPPPQKPAPSQPKKKRPPKDDLPFTIS